MHDNLGLVIDHLSLVPVRGADIPVCLMMKSGVGSEGRLESLPHCRPACSWGRHSCLPHDEKRCWQRRQAGKPAPLSAKVYKWERKKCKGLETEELHHRQGISGTNCPNLIIGKGFSFARIVKLMLDIS